MKNLLAILLLIPHLAFSLDFECEGFFNHQNVDTDWEKMKISFIWNGKYYKIDSSSEDVLSLDFKKVYEDKNVIELSALFEGKGKLIFLIYKIENSAISYQFNYEKNTLEPIGTFNCLALQN